MLRIGHFNELEVTKIMAAGAMVDGGSCGTVLLTARAGEAFEANTRVNVFIYRDSEGELAATTLQPLAIVGEIAWLKIVTVNQVGAFASWGLPRDLFIPFAEQQYPLSIGSEVLVRVYIDNQDRLAGSTRIDRWVEDEAEGLSPGDKVSLIIADKTELGYKAIINHRWWGLLYNSELFQSVRKGQSVTGYINRIRADHRVDLSLSKPGYSKNKIDVIADQIITRLEQNDGRLLLTDKSPPPVIYAEFGVSKKIFKQAVGALYKNRRITLDPEGMSLNENN